MPIPDKFKNAPELLPGVELYFNGYLELAMFAGTFNDRRQILWADAHMFAQENGFDPEQRDCFMDCVAALDREWINWQNKKRGRGNGNRNKAAIAANTKASSRHR